jgi:hypothetical protein
MFKRAIPLMAAAIVLVGCGMFGGGAPGKTQVQAAMDRMAKETPILFGTDKPIVKDAKCSKAGNDTFACVVSMATSSEPQPRTVNVQMTKLSGEWHAQMTGLGF